MPPRPPHRKAAGGISPGAGRSPGSVRARPALTAPPQLPLSPRRRPCRRFSPTATATSRIPPRGLPPHRPQGRPPCSGPAALPRAAAPRRWWCGVGRGGSAGPGSRTALGAGDSSPAAATSGCPPLATWPPPGAVVTCPLLPPSRDAGTGSGAARPPPCPGAVAGPPRGQWLP